MPNPALWNDEDFREDCRSSRYAHEPETVRCSVSTCRAVVNKEDAFQTEDGKEWLCGDCHEWIAAMCGERGAA